MAELTGTVQACVTLWEGGMSLADVTGAPFLDLRTMAQIGCSSALRGEAVLLIGSNGLVPCSDWDLSTRNGEPRAYRLALSEVSGQRSVTALSAEVLHLRIGADPTTP